MICLACSSVSTPSAITFAPSAWESLIVDSMIASDFLLSLDEESVQRLIVETNDLLTFVNSLVKFDFTSYHAKKAAVRTE